MNKKIIIGIVIGVLIIIIGIVTVILLKEPKQDGGTESAGLSEISFNGIKIGDKIEEKMKNLVMDAWGYTYEYKNINIGVDEDDNIDYLGINTTTNAEGRIMKGIPDAKIKYNGKKLETVEDFKTYFGEGTIRESSNESNYFIDYQEGELKLELYILDGNLYNVELKKEIND